MSGQAEKMYSLFWNFRLAKTVAGDTVDVGEQSGKRSDLMKSVTFLYSGHHVTK